MKAESRFLEKVNKGLGKRRKDNLVWEKNFERMIEFQVKTLARNSTSRILTVESIRTT